MARGAATLHRSGALALVASLLALAGAGAAAAAPAWNPTTDLAPGATSAGGPVVAVDGKGNAVAAWLTVTPSVRNVQVSEHRAGGSWGSPMTLASGSTIVGPPQLAVDANGDAFVAWSQGPDSAHIQMRALYRPAGESWQTTDVFGDPSLVSAGPRLAVNAHGDEVLAWTTTDSSAGTSVPYATVRAAGGAWLTPERLSTSATQPQTPYLAVAIDPNGDATVAWEFKDQPSSHSVIQVSRHVPGGFFPWSFIPATLSNTAHDAYMPAIASDASGNATALWAENNGTSNQVLGADFSAGSGNWGSPYAVSGADANVLSPAIAFDQHGDATATWDLGSAPSHQWIQSSDRPAGGSWSHPATNVSGDFGGADLNSLVLSVAPSGAAVTGWSEDAVGPFQVSASVRNAGGTWQPPHVPDPDTNHGYTDPSVAVDDNGNAVVLYSGQAVRSATYSAPAFSGASIPATGTVGAQVAVTASATDVWSPVTTTWSFGDGGHATGVSATHTYSTPGTYPVSVSAANLGGATASSSGTITISPPVAVPAPVLSHVSESHRAWARSSKLARIAARHRIPVGTTFSLTLNEPAALKLAFSQLLRGRSVGGRCVRPTHANRSRHSCQRQRPAGTLALSGHTGLNRVAFFGQLSRKRRLGKGPFQVLITATSSGKLSAPVMLRFSIVR